MRYFDTYAVIMGQELPSRCRVIEDRFLFAESWYVAKKYSQEIRLMKLDVAYAEWEYCDEEFRKLARDARMKEAKCVPIMISSLRVPTFMFTELAKKYNAEVKELEL